MSDIAAPSATTTTTTAAEADAVVSADSADNIPLPADATATSTVAAAASVDISDVAAAAVAVAEHRSGGVIAADDSNRQTDVQSDDATDILDFELVHESLRQLGDVRVCFCLFGFYIVVAFRFLVCLFVLTLSGCAAVVVSVCADDNIAAAQFSLTIRSTSCVLLWPSAAARCALFK